MLDVFAYFRAGVLTYVCGWRVCILMCSRAWHTRALVCLRIYMFSRIACLCTCMLGIFLCLHAHILECSNACVFCVLTCLLRSIKLRAYMLVCLVWLFFLFRLQCNISIPKISISKNLYVLLRWICFVFTPWYQFKKLHFKTNLKQRPAFL